MTSNDVRLSDGAFALTMNDLSFPGAATDWSHSRFYDSKTRAESGEEVNSSAGIRMSTSGGPTSRIYKTDNGDVFVYFGKSSRRRFAPNAAGGFDAPFGYHANLTQRDDGNYELNEYDTDQVMVFSDPDAPGGDGNLMECSTEALMAAGMPGNMYMYNDSGFVDMVMTAGPQSEMVNYTYRAAGANSGRLSRVEIDPELLQFQPAPQGVQAPAAPSPLAVSSEGGFLKLSGGGVGIELTPKEFDRSIGKVEYLYYGDAAEFHSDLGSLGDMVQVKMSYRTSSGNFDERYTQYRYYRGSVAEGNNDADGQAHELKLVFENDAIDRIVRAGANLQTPEDVLELADDDLVAGRPLSYYATRQIKYYVSDFNTANVNGVNLEALYGGVGINEAPAGEPGFVKSASTTTGCGSCGSGGNDGVGTTSTYYYMDINGGSEADNDASVVVRIAVEDMVDSDGQFVYRKVTGVNNLGAALREATIEDPTVGSIQAWCRSILVDAEGRMTESRDATAHTVVNSASRMRQFLNPTVANDNASTNSNTGRVTVYEYDDDGYQTGMRIKQGRGSTSNDYLSAMDYENYGDADAGATNFLPSASYVYRVQTPERNEGIKTTYTYEFWDTDRTIIKKRTTSQPVIEADQNGSGEAYTTEAYYDRLGRMIWQKDGVGFISYTAYHPTLGGVSLQVTDVDPASMDAEFITGNEFQDPWESYGANDNRPARAGKVAETDPIAHFSKTEFDFLGRARKRIDDSGHEHYTAYNDNQTIQFPYFNRRDSGDRMPISVSNTNDGDQTIETYQVEANFSGGIELGSDGGPIGFSGAGPTQDNYIGLTRMFYDSVSGQMVKTLRYHDIPGSGNGQHIDNYYISAYDYDAQGRRKLSIQTSTATEHQVTRTVFDFLSRGVETQRGSLDSGLDVSASNTLGTLAGGITDGSALTRMLTMVYDGGGPGESWVTSNRRFYGTGANDFTESLPQYTWRGFSRGSLNRNGSIDYGPYQLNDVDWLG